MVRHKKSLTFLFSIMIISAAGLLYSNLYGEIKSMEVMSTACVYGKAEIIIGNTGSSDLIKGDWGDPTITYLKGTKDLSKKMATPDRVSVGAFGVFEHECGFENTCQYDIITGRQIHKVQIAC